MTARQNLAHVLAERLAQPEESLRQLDELVKLDADNSQHWAGRGVVLARLGRLAEAIGDLSHASTLRITNPLVGYQVACGYSLVAEALDAPADSERPRAEAVPSQQQIAAAALKWYQFSLRNHPSIAQIAEEDPDIRWLRNQAAFPPIHQAP